MQIRHIPNMKHKPQTLPTRRSSLLPAVFAAVLAAGIFLPAYPLLAQQEQGDSGGEPQKAAAATPSDKSASEVLSAITRKLKDSQTLSCNLQQTVLMSGQKMLAAGRYVQGTGNRMRLEFRIFPVKSVSSQDRKVLDPAAEAADTSDLKISGALTQISDGSVLWAKWQNGPVTEVTRRNIREILDAVQDIENTTPADSLRSLGIGGLQTLISQLQVGMEFGQVKEQTIAGNTVYILTGRWSSKTRENLFQIPDGDLNAPLPAYVPDFVRIYVDKQESLPRRIEYLKRHPNPEVKQAQPLVLLDFRNIELNKPVNESMFDITQEESADDVEEKDLTRDVIDAIKAAAGQPTGDSPVEETPSSDK